LQLKSKKKYVLKTGEISSRSKSSKDTLEEIGPLSEKIVTRISDITYLDKLYIPNYSATLPGTEDSIWVYSGKGITKADAKTSALMEAVERYSSLSETCRIPVIRGTYAELSRSYNVLHPDEVVEYVNPAYEEENSIIDFLPGYDLSNNENLLVPVQLALSKYHAKLPTFNVFPYSHTNGLASGNELEEAVYHALCEVIERDATSIAELCASSIPYNILERITDLLSQPEYGGYSIPQFDAAERFVDDPNMFPIVDISELQNNSEPVSRLIQRFVNSGITLLIKNITQKDIGIPTFVASSVEWITHDYGYFAKGYGTHLDTKTALIRAITELSQTRAVNIQGARDDLKKINYKEHDEIYKRKWAFMDTFFKSNNQSGTEIKTNNIIKFQEIETHVNRDILDDINLIHSRLRRVGLKIIIVELTNPKIGIPVVRVIVPGLETFEVNGSIMGNRAKRYFRTLNMK
jgi:ribosomal protein S12 methylthiotransferase accessory factor